MRRRIPAVAVAVALALAAACDSSTEPERGVRLTTDRASYTPGRPITAKLQNLLSESVYLSHCNWQVALRLERRSAAGEWSAYRQLNHPCPAIYPAGERELASGGILTETFTIDEPGAYRLLGGGRAAHEDFGSLVFESGVFLVAWPPD